MALGWVRWVGGCDESQPYSRDSLGFCGGSAAVALGIGVNLSFETSLLSARWTPVELVLGGCQRQTSRGFGACQPLGLRVWGGWGRWVGGCDESQPYSRNSLVFCGGSAAGALGIGVNLSFETSLLSARWTPVELVLAGCQR